MPFIAGGKSVAWAYFNDLELWHLKNYYVSELLYLEYLCLRNLYRNTFFLYIYWNTFKLIKYLYFSIHLIFHLFLFILLIYFHTFYFSLLYQFSSLKTNSVGSHFCVASIETDLSHIFMTSCSELYRSIVLGRLWWCYICVYFI